MLVIDDVGVRSATESVRSLVHSIINARLTNNKPTIFTSNARLSNLGAVLYSRLQDRIGDHCVQHKSSAKSNSGMRSGRIIALCYSYTKQYKVKTSACSLDTEFEMNHSLVTPTRRLTILLRSITKTTERCRVMQWSLTLYLSLRMFLT